jgi:4-amino-4-deoxy-L-arabinose transferase-like glycosyltransferase
MAPALKSSQSATKNLLKAFPTLSRPVACALIILFWAAIYLPGLGSIEIKGEEIRRIMPGVAMLETGNWIVPHFNGYPYLRKPPLVNWAIALSIKAFGARTEWTVRFPSVLAMLAMGLVMLYACAPWLGVNAALAAVLIAYTSAGIVEKGRIAEIEAIYIALFGMAFSCWLGWTATGRSRWLIWPVTGLFLGLGLLAKGPPNLAFFYAIAGFIAWRSARKKGTTAAMDTGLASWAHLCGVIIMIGVFALWCVPYMRQASTLGAGGVWARQMEQRIGGGDTGTVFINFLRSLVNFLPWALALPLFWRRATLSRLSARDRLIVEAARWPIVICAFVLMFIPGMLPRYTLPLVIPYALLLALLLKAQLESASLRWPLAAGCVAGVGMIAYAVFVAPLIATRGPARAFAAQINAIMPPGSPIYIFDPSVQPQIFYIHGRLIYEDTAKILPNDVPWLLAPQTALKALRSKFRQCQVLAQPRDQGGKQYAFLSLHGGTNRNPLPTAPAVGP